MTIPDVSDVATVATTDAVGAFNVVFLEVVPQVEAVGVDVATVRAHGGVTSLKLKFGSEGEGLGRLQGIKSGHSHSTTAYFSKQNDIYIIIDEFNNFPGNVQAFFTFSSLQTVFCFS